MKRNTKKAAFVGEKERNMIRIYADDRIIDETPEEGDPEMKVTNCKNCGAPFGRYDMQCKYCGSSRKEEEHDGRRFD